MKIERSYLTLYTFKQMAADYLIRKKGKENKICDSILSFEKQFEKINDSHMEEAEDCRRNNCMTVKDGEKKGAIIYDDVPNNLGGVTRQKCFTPAGEKQLNIDLKALMDKKVEVHSRIAEGEGIKELIAELTPDEREIFSGIVIPEQPIVKEDE